MAPSRKKPSKRRPKASKELHETASVVGPSYFQVLELPESKEGTFSFFGGKQVNLVLCGESHEDAIDVTRKSGRFEPNEGWIERERTVILIASNTKAMAMSCVTKYQVLASNGKRSSISVEQAKDWGKNRIEEDDEVLYDHRVILLWIQSEQQKKAKGKAYLLCLGRDDEEADSDDDTYTKWIAVNSAQDDLISKWITHSTDETASEVGRYRSFAWEDLDSEAHELNQRRRSDEEISTAELDSIVQKRKEERRSSNSIWTWDDWFSHIQTGARNVEVKEIDVHLVLEASVPPWELQLHRPSRTSLPKHGEGEPLIPAAPHYVRSIPQDEESDDDDYDPSNDGVGSYLDFIYRRFMDQQVRELPGKTSWLHCVDTRDLGCQSACHTEYVKCQWNDLLLKEEKEALANESNTPNHRPPNFDRSDEVLMFLPEHVMNPERAELLSLQSRGLLQPSEKDDDDKEAPDDDEFTFPSFEGFFGQASDSLYYNPNIKLSYSPFLSQCVGSLLQWESFFTALFFGGTISEAVAILDLEKHTNAVYVRSPIATTWNNEKESHEYQARTDGDHYITYPFFPFLFYLTAAQEIGADQHERTWSSDLFARLCGPALDDNASLTATARQKVALAAREWTLESIHRHSKDPKGSDDPHCGGEWFEAYLRALHRDIYDDIDRSDASALLRSKSMKSQTEYGKKYNVGDITIPSTADGFSEITARFAMESQLAHSEQLVTEKIECMAKILIDIWMSSLVDFSTVLKINEAIFESKSDRVFIVCYMGSAHTRAVSEFFVNRIGFKKKLFVGKVDWDDNERRTMQLPSSLWTISELFK